MGKKIFLAGATGAIGRRLVPLLQCAGYEVFGTTRSATKAGELRTAGVEPIVVDVFDAVALNHRVMSLRPQVIIHQLTDLPHGLDPKLMSEAGARNARIRREGTGNLIAAALAAGVGRMIAQSIAWAYAPGPQPYRETALLDIKAVGSRATSVQGVVALERLTLESPPLSGTVLRYGQLYGPGTGSDGPAGSAPVHVDAAAHAALLALERGAVGIFNIAEDSGFVSTEKAQLELGWQASFRLE